MKIVRVRLAGDEIAYGAVELEGIRVHRGTPFVAWEPTETLVPFERAHLLAPVFPTKVVAVGRNYADHAAERGVEVPAEPVIFLKPATAVIGPDAPVVLPPEAEEVHHEAELAVVVGRVAHRVAAEDAGAFILGYTAANDISARDLQKRDGQWARAKGFDTFCPLGPAIETEVDPGDLAISCRGQRGDPPAGHHRRHGVRGGGAVRLHQPGDDPAPRRRDPDRHPGGDRAAAARGPHGGGHRAHRGAAEPGGGGAMTVRVRFPPSPTGSLHVGTGRTVLYNWLFARHHGGAMVFRVDDTDAERSTEEFLADIIEGLRWLGLDWDEGIEVGGPQGDYRQSRRLARYQEVARQLVASGWAYYDFATPEELEALRLAAAAAGRSPVYDGTLPGAR